jgi:hypothetical protein
VTPKDGDVTKEPLNIVINNAGLALFDDLSDRAALARTSPSISLAHME